VSYLLLDTASLLERVARKVPADLRAHTVVIGSIAAAWSFRDVAGAHTVATKDIDLLLRPAVAAVDTATTLGLDLLEDGWLPQFPDGRSPGTVDTPDDALPALRLAPPGENEGWFIELLAEPPADQVKRKQWRRFVTPAGHFGLPSFRYMPVAIDMPEDSPYGLPIARPLNMALANLLEHTEADRTPMSSFEGRPPRFVKDVGRAVALWWLANQQSPRAPDQWLRGWRACIGSLYPHQRVERAAAARQGLLNLRGYQREAHQIAVLGVLAAHQTSLAAFERAFNSLLALLEGV